MKIQEHISAILRILEFLPIIKVRVETAEFDTQRLKAMAEGKPLLVGTDYQLGEMYDEYNVRQYVLHRDEYTCQCCKKNKEGTKLHVHHIESRQVGGNAPNNLITLCPECHEAIHASTKKLPELKRGKPLKDAAFMGIMRKTLMAKLRALLELRGIVVEETYGYITKFWREYYHIEKTHINDALMISRNFNVVPDDVYYYTKPVRHHNRQIHKTNAIKGGIRKLNQAPHAVKGLRLFDTVEYEGDTYFVFGRRTSGFMDIRKLDGTKVNKGAISSKKIKFVRTNKGLLTERRRAIPPADKSAGFLAQYFQ